MRCLFLYRLVMQLCHYLSSWHNYRTIGHVRRVANLLISKTRLESRWGTRARRWSPGIFPKLRNLTRPSASSCTSARMFNAPGFCTPTCFCSIYGHTPLGRRKRIKRWVKKATHVLARNVVGNGYKGFEHVVHHFDGTCCFLPFTFKISFQN